MSNQNSADLFTRALEFIPGGVNSPVRAFKAVGGKPLFIERGEGAYVVDADQNRYIDYVCSWGAVITGHADPRIVEPMREAAGRGLSFGAPTRMETQLAERIVNALPAVDKVRLVNSGTEACMSALRLARAFTGRDKIVKFSGCYHGHADMLLVSAGSGVATLGLPDSPGVPKSAVEHTVTIPFNDKDALDKLMSEIGQEVAAIIVEPYLGNGGFIKPAEGYLQQLREVTRNTGSLLVFDEVMTGFRVFSGGAQVLHGVEPDIVCLAKVIGGGMPIGAYGGRAEIMNMVAPAGPMYQAGTLSGNPVAVAAGDAALSILEDKSCYDHLNSVSSQLVEGLQDAAKSAKVPFLASNQGGMFGMVFSDKPITSFEDVKNTDIESFNRFFWGMLRKGIYFAPSAFEAGFVSLAHGEKEVNQTVEMAYQVFKSL